MKNELASKFDEKSEGFKALPGFNTLYHVLTPSELEVMLKKAFCLGAEANEELNEETCIKLMAEEDIDPHAG